MRLIIIAIIAFLCSGCFGRFVMTKKELKAYYQNKAKPTYFTIQNDSVKLFCATSGADTLPPLLIVHGAPGAWYGSRNLLGDKDVQRQYHIIAVDRPGYNKSRYKGRRKAVVSIERQAIAIHEALRLNRSRKPGVLLGSSYGGPIAAKLALLYPSEFHHLVMLAPAIDPDKEKFWWFNKWVHHGPVRWVLPHFLNVATDEKYAHIRELQKLLPEWRNLSIPVTVVQGGADHIVDPANLEFAKTQLKGKDARFIYLPDAGHLIRLQNPELVKSLLQPANQQQGSNYAK